MIDPTYFCPGCNTCLGCTCPPPGYEDALWEEAYERGYEACQADGYGEHPLYWVSVTDEAEAALCRDWRHLCMGGSLTDTRGQRFYGSNVFNAWPKRWPWPFRSNPLTGEIDPEAYLMGWDDAGTGLPSVVSDPDAYAVSVRCLEEWGFLADLYRDPIGPLEVEERCGNEDWLPF